MRYSVGHTVCTTVGPPGSESLSRCMTDTILFTIVQTILTVRVQSSVMNAKRVLIGVTVGVLIGSIITKYRRRVAQRDQTLDRARLDEEREVGIIKL